MHKKLKHVLKKMIISLFYFPVISISYSKNQFSEWQEWFFWTNTAKKGL